MGGIAKQGRPAAHTCRQWCEVREGEDPEAVISFAYELPNLRREF